MKVYKFNLKLSVLSLAMAGAFSSMYAYADDEEAAALMNPASSVEVEMISVSTGSQKFGEYNGLNRSGGYVNGNINIRGGDGYKKNEAGDTTRWSVQGTDLGLTDRSASVGYSDQGNWGASVGYDQLQHNLAPGYQTPYNGQMGGNNFTLPSNFQAVQTSVASGGTPLAGTKSLTPTQLGAFSAPAISSTRENTSFSATKVIDSSLNATFDFNHLNQTGAKLMSFAGAGLGNTSVAGVSGETPSILPNPTNYQTDTLNAALNWQGEKARLSGSYFGSFFRDGYNQVNWQTFAGAIQTQTMSTAPSNQLQQLNLSGGYDFSSKTKLVSNLSYGRNTQNSQSGYDSFMLVNGAGSAPAFNGLVNTAHFDIKATDQSVKDLSLLAGYKYDSRDNLSQSNIQQLYGVDGAHPTFYPNTPLSTKKSQFELAGDYRLSSNQKARLAYTNTFLSRSCNQYATGTAPSTSPYTSNAANIATYPAGADCVTANFSRSNNLTATYKVKANESVDFKLLYGVDARQTTWNQTAIASFSGANVNNALAPVSLGYVPGQNGGDWLGFHPFFEASRNQQLVKGSMNWQASENLGIFAGAKYTYDQYPDSTYGVTNGNAWALNLDANYAYAENSSLVAYAVQQNSMRNLTNKTSSSTYYSGTAGTVAPYAVGTWTNAMTENATTLGFGVRHGGLMSGKLNLTGDATYSLGQSNYSTNINSAKTGYDCSSAYYGTCGSPGTIRNSLAAIKLGASYQLDKQSKIGLRYIYQHLYSNDYYINGLQYGSTPATLMPTNQTTGSYSVNVIAASYTYMFD